MLKNELIKRTLIVWLGLVVCLLTAFSEQVNAKSSKKSAGFLNADKRDIQQWRQMKFGLFIHWGPVSLKGTEISWSRGGRGPIPAEEYDNLYKQFNPVKFNADEWVQIARDAGMKYMVFTSKHHDGFSMFDTRQSDYKITSKDSPYGKDVCKQLADACHKAGLKLGYYYSPADWYHPDYHTENHSRYIKFLHGQIRELCTNYGRLDIMWFDGGHSAKDCDSENLFRMIRRLQPHIIINNRGGLPGDFHTPEQRVGGFNRERPWETCMTICRQWAWKPNDRMKSLEQSIQTLIKVVGGDGNLLFNVGPMPDGRIEPRQVERLKEMGAWLKKYGDGVYGTRGGPFKPGKWGASTCKGDSIYLYVINWHAEGKLVLPPIRSKLVGHRTLSAGKARVTQHGYGIEIDMPAAQQDSIATVIKLKVKGKALDIEPVDVPDEPAYLHARDELIRQWQDKRFGMFIHWGPVSLKGTEIGWSRKGPRRGRKDKRTGSIPVEIYDNLYKQFNPVKFNADEWAQIAKDAGMKYMVFTSKHHDGFSMFDTRQTDYKITSKDSPYGKDVCKQLADACRRHGLGLGWYYSPRDWYHPYFATKKHQKYLEFYMNQLRELCTKYGKVDILWFDGLDSPRGLWGDTPVESYKMLRTLQPDIILNNRGGLPGDFHTPEQRVGGFDRERPWETCMTICRQWAWKPNDQMKSLEQCIQILVQTAGGDGNLLLNVGPMPDGRIEPRQVERLKEMGAWLKKYGDGVYGTRGGPFKPGKWGASTCKGDSIYLYVMNWHTEGKLVLPPIRNKLVGHRTLSAGEARVTQYGYGIEIDMPAAQQDSIATVIKLKVKGKALDIEPVGVPDEPAYLHARDELIRQWQDKRFGMFIHWGPVSLKGTEIGWSRGGERRGGTGRGSIPVEIYDNLYKQFNPVKFNADEWVQIAKDAGMKYMVFTSKHHDGFSMFDTRQTDYKITSKDSPYGKDVCKQLADACHKTGLKLGYYYSPPDWYHPDYRTENHSRYIKFLHGQLREICSNYGKIDIIWFDGLGGKAKDWDSENLFRMIRRLQPHVIINNRAGLPGDHDTPEQRVGRFQNDRPWETCMTICRQWAWKPNDQLKSTKQCIQTLIKVVGGDGNLLFNVGPMPDGRIEPRQVARLKEMGDWLDKYGRSIYATRGGPFKPGSWGTSTYKGNTIYIHILNWPEDTLTLPPIPNKIIASSVMTGGAATVRQTKQAIEISVPKSYRKELDTIIVLQIDGPANKISPRALPSDSLTAEKKAKASNTFQNMSSYSPAKAVDDDLATRWATDSGTKQAWLEVDMGKPMTFNRVKISEAYDRVRGFELQYKDGNRWKTFARGTKIGSDYSKQFKPVTARYVRLNILKFTDGPTIWEFQLFAPKK